MNRFDATGRRVVVTGWGCVSRLGLTLDATWNALCDATTSQHEFFPAHRDDASRLGPLAKWKSTFVDIRFRQTAGPVGQYAIVATLEALQSAGIEPGSIPADRIGVLIGSMFGGLQEIHRIDRLLQRGKKSRAGTMGSTRCLNSSAAVNVSAAIGAQSECHSPSTMFCSGLDSIGFAAELISQGVLDCAVCGGSDEDCLDVVGPALLKLDSLDDEGLDAPGRGRPFDQQRNGIIPAAGTGILILESAEAATARGARILAELAGYGTAFAPTSPGTPAAVTAIEQSIRDTSLPVDVVACTAAGLREQDRELAEALQQTVQTEAPVTSIVGALGHCGGATSALSAVMAAKMLSEETVLPTFGLTDLDPDCSGLRFVESRDTRPVTSALVVATSFGFGAALLLNRTPS